MKKMKVAAAWCLTFSLAFSMLGVAFAGESGYGLSQGASEILETAEEGTEDENVQTPDGEEIPENGNSEETPEDGTEELPPEDDQEEQLPEEGETEEPEVPNEDDSEEDSEDQNTPEEVSADVSYEVHMQDYGWNGEKGNGEEAGVTGESKRMEAFKVRVSDEKLTGGIRYRAHVQDYGWQDYREDGELAGTEGESKRIEAIQMYLTGELAEVYDVYYTIHIQNYGWMKWTKGSETEEGWCGSSGLSLRAESLRIMLVKKGETPEDNGATHSYHTKYTLGTVLYSGHQQDYGDLAPAYDGASLGKTGEGKRLEAFVIEKGAELQKLDGEIMYRAHVQDIGTQDWVSSGQKAGTSGQSKRVEAIQVYLTGELAEQYDIYYRVHVQEAGWMKWVQGSSEESGWAGTEGLGFRIEALQIKVLAKGSGAPADDKASYGYVKQADVARVTYSGHQQDYGDLAPVSNGATLGKTGESRRIEALKIYRSQSSVVSGSIQYRAHVQDYGWMSWVADGAMAGTSGESKRLEAIQIKLAGDVSIFCDVWYRVHTQEFGWLGWAKNGQSAGTSSLGYRIEAVQIQIVPKGQPAPGANSDYFRDKTPAEQRIYNHVLNVYSKVGRNLKACYDWVVRTMTYQTISSHPTPPAGYSRVQMYAVRAFETHKGNCYCYAAAFYYLAKYLGYNAEYVEGYVTAINGGYTRHGWVEIDGKYICDPEAQAEIGGHNFYMQPKGNPLLSYKR